LLFPHNAVIAKYSMSLGHVSQIRCWFRNAEVLTPVISSNEIWKSIIKIGYSWPTVQECSQSHVWGVVINFICHQNNFVEVTGLSDVHIAW